MSSPSSARLSHVFVARHCGMYRMAYREWGDPANPRLVLCVHGLTRNGRDFEPLAERLSVDFRVVAPDVLGRGESDWLRDPLGYQPQLYAQDMVTLLARLNVVQCDWIGTSLGGIIAMWLAPILGRQLRRLVLNDVGPVLALPAVSRIGDYVGKNIHFASRAEAEKHLRTILAPFGPHSEAHWAFLIDVALRARGEGWSLHYDPNIAIPFRQVDQLHNFRDSMVGIGQQVLGPTAWGSAHTMAQAVGTMVHAGLQAAGLPPGSAQAGINLWSCYDRIQCPTLLLRGAQSDLLDETVADAMTRRGPRARRIDFPGVGHAPTLLSEEQQAAVAGFLRE